MRDTTIRHQRRTRSCYYAARLTGQWDRRSDRNAGHGSCYYLETPDPNGTTTITNQDDGSCTHGCTDPMRTGTFKGTRRRSCFTGRPTRMRTYDPLCGDAMYYTAPAMRQQMIRTQDTTPVLHRLHRPGCDNYDRTATRTAPASYTRLHRPECGQHDQTATQDEAQLTTTLDRTDPVQQLRSNRNTGRQLSLLLPGLTDRMGQTVKPNTGRRLCYYTRSRPGADSTIEPQRRTTALYLGCTTQYGRYDSPQRDRLSLAGCPARCCEF
jgi:hypothetical protein